MKKRLIPLLLASLAVAFVFGLQMGARTQQEQSEQDMLERTTNTIAVINADAGVQVNGSRLNYAAAIIDTLDYNFTLVSPAMAQAGLDSGMYSAVVTFPSTVSTRILSFNAHMPERVELEFTISPHLSDREFLETFIAITELQLAINTTLANTYVASILGQFHEAQDHVYGVFQNNMLDLMALQFLTHGDFTYDLQLDYVPQIPLNPRELDREFYMGQVAMFAQQVSDLYLNSYQMASNQFLSMREGLFRLTEDFPEQKNTWLDMLTDWTRLSEEYSELLEIYSEYVREHDLSLYDWFQENRTWNSELEEFQLHLTDWHDTSIGWFETWEAWHGDYLGYLDAVIEFRDAVDAFRETLDENASMVVHDLEMFLAALQDYEYGLNRQLTLFERLLTEYDGEREAANQFFARVTMWHGDLEYTHEAFEEWQYDILYRQEELIAFHGELGESRDAIEELFNGFMEYIYNLPEMPVAPDGVDLLYLWEAIGPTTIEPIEYNLQIPLPCDREALSEFIELLQLPPSMDDMPTTFDIPSMLDLSLLTIAADNIPIAPPLDIDIIEPPPSFNIEIPSLGDLQSLPIEQQHAAIADIHFQLIGVNMEFSFWHGSNGNVVGDINAARSSVLGWHESLYESVFGYDGWHSELLSIVALLGGWHGALYELVGYVDPWVGEDGHIQYMFDELELWHYELSGFHVRMQDEVYPALYFWHVTLEEIDEELTDWEERLHLFAYGGYYLEYDEDNEEEKKHIPGLLCVHDALYEIHETWFPIEIAIPYYEEWYELTIPEDADVDLPLQAALLEELLLPAWYEDIFAPNSYSGADIQDAFSTRFPLQDHAMAAPIDMSPPPQYLGVYQPDMVGDHPVTTAAQPQNPVVGAPPQPDNFWRSLDRMHSQLSSFDVAEFLSDDIRRRVDSSVQSYDAFLASLSGDITHLFSDNIVRMYDVHGQHERYLQNLRRSVFAAQAAEQNALQNALSDFADARTETSDNTQERLGTFASMMPESRVAGNVNHELVSFTVAPFDFVPVDLREDPAPIIVFTDPSVVNFQRHQMISIIVLAGVLFATIAGSAISHVVKNRKNKDS